MLEPCAMLENLWNMNEVRVSEGTSGIATMTDRETARTAPAADRAAVKITTATDRETIRLATAADREGIRRLVNQAFEVERFLKKGGGDRLQDDGEFEELWERGTFLVKEEAGLVKEEDGALVGCVYVEPRGERAYLGCCRSNRHGRVRGWGSS
jgi:hypothetical protein